MSAYRCTTKLDQTRAVKEFQCLCRDLRGVGLQIEVQPGRAQSLLLFSKAPKRLLGSTVYRSRYVHMYACTYVERAGAELGEAGY